MAPQRYGHRMQSIQAVVARHPGQTAHWLASYVYGQRRPAWNRVYAAFQRATMAGLIEARVDGKRTRYYIGAAS
jgi:hypothetical protein